MPASNIIMATIISVAFIAFAVGVLWAEVQSAGYRRDLQKAGVSPLLVPPPLQPTHLDMGGQSCENSGACDGECCKNAALKLEAAVRS